MHILLILLSLAAIDVVTGRAHALEAEKTTIYCVDRRIEISTWDLEQMKVRRGSNVCAFSSFTSSSSATSFAEKNFGGQGKTCSCD